MLEQTLTTGLKTIGDTIVQALIDEFTQQGHSNTGKTIESIVCTVQAFSDGYGLDLSFAQYANYLDKGVPASKVPFSPGSGAKSSKYINALMQWATQRGLVSSQKQAKSMAFAIARRQKLEGMPTRGSLAFSNTGSRTGFFSGNKIFDTVDEKVQALLDETVYSVLNDAIAEVQNYINQNQTNA